MLRNLTIVQYLWFHKHQCKNLNACLNINSRESFFFNDGNSIRFNDSEMMIQKNLKGLETMEVLITLNVNVSLGNEWNSYIYTARNIW